MRLIKNEDDLRDFENETGVDIYHDYLDDKDILPNYPYFLDIKFGGESYNGKTTRKYVAFSVDDAWKLLWADAEMKVAAKGL